MAQYIDKDALIAEIDRRMRLRKESYDSYHTISDFVAWEELEYLKEDFLPTLEVKEVDIDTVEELNKYGIQNPKQRDVCIAHHFFELGMAVGIKA